MGFCEIYDDAVQGAPTVDQTAAQDAKRRQALESGVAWYELKHPETFENNPPAEYT